MARRYQEGGLAAVAGVEDEEEDYLDAALTTQDEIIESAKQGESYGTRARRISKMTRDKALNRLQAGYDKLAAQKSDKRDRWLAIAQGMLAPTKTGGFGESLGTAAGLLGEQRQEEREFDTERAERLAAMEAEMAGAEEAYADREIDILGEEERARRTTRRKAWQPRLYMDEGTGDIYEAIQGQDDQGGLVTNWTTKEPPKDAVLTPMTSLSPELQLKLSNAKTTGTLDAETIDKSSVNARQARLDLADAYYGLTLLEELKEAGGTGGFQKKLNEVRSWLGSDAKDVTDRNVLMNIFGVQLIEKLGAFGYNPSQKDLEIAQQLSADLAQPGATNEQILHDWVRKLEEGLRIDMHVVNEYGNDRQKFAVQGPLINKGISPELIDYASEKGFTFEEYKPFPTKEAPVIVPRKEGDIGTLDAPHEFESAEEFNRIMNDPKLRKMRGIQKRDYLDVPGVGIKRNNRE